MQLVTIDESGLKSPRDYRSDLEAGNILFFPKTPFELPPTAIEYLRNLDFAGGKIHKNIAYRTSADRVTGIDPRYSGFETLHKFFRDYSRNITALTAETLPGYAKSWKLDYASFRPVEEEGRDLPVNKRNDLIHTDAFPSRPTNGDLILRVFTNVNATRSRVWLTSEPFESIAQLYAKGAGLDKLAASGASPTGRLKNRILRALRGMGLPVVPRSAYDQFMLNFHEYLKRNDEFQRAPGKYRFEFPPGSTWMAFTDVVPHSVQSGQHALEQTLIIARKSMATPQNAPLAILERICGRPLLNAAA